MQTHAKPENTILVPAPSIWPMVTAFGIALLFLGLVTHAIVGVAGIAILLRGAVGWWREVLPHERHQAVLLEPAELAPVPAVSTAREVDHLAPGREGHRVRIPAEIHPYSAGVLAGAAGAVTMAAVAVLFGLIAHHSAWYPINLLAAGVIPSLASAGDAQLKQFSAAGFTIASLIHILTSLLVGVLYAVLLPMFPRRAGLWTGLVAPLVWSGLIASTIGVINPTLNARIDWTWFVLSQIGFGLTAAYFISRAEPVETMQTWPLADRAGLEARRPGPDPEEE